MQDLIADMEREIAVVKQQAIELRAKIIRIETLQTRAALDPILQEQLTHLKRSFERTKTTLSGMEARKKSLLERMAQASTQSKSSTEPDFTGTVEEQLAQMRRALGVPQPFSTLENECFDSKIEPIQQELTVSEATALLNQFSFLDKTFVGWLIANAYNPVSNSITIERLHRAANHGSTAFEQAEKALQNLETQAKPLQ
jgi:hypothetical protein